MLQDERAPEVGAAGPGRKIPSLQALLRTRTEWKATAEVSRSVK
jgi:hypothetical protein